MMKINSFNASSSSFKNFDELQAFVLVDARANTIGTVLRMNDAFRKIIKLKNIMISSSLKINSLIPQVLNQVHDKILKNFNATGESRIINRKTT